MVDLTGYDAPRRAPRYWISSPLTFRAGEGPWHEGTSVNIGAPVSFTANATDNVDTGLTPTCNQTSGALFPLGATVITCSVTDGAGNVGSASVTVTVVDTTAPTLTVPAPITVAATSAAGAVVTYTASASDLVDGAIAPSCSPASDTMFPLGATPVSCSATDRAGNTVSKSFTVTVADNGAPVLALPDPITGEATGPSGAVVTYTASASDAIDGPIAIGCSPVSGSTFGLGTTTVACSATDGAGNTATGSFTVTVRDTTAPVLTAASRRRAHDDGWSRHPQLHGDGE